MHFVLLIPVQFEMLSTHYTHMWCNLITNLTVTILNFKLNLDFK